MSRCLREMTVCDVMTLCVSQSAMT